MKSRGVIRGKKTRAQTVLRDLRPQTLERIQLNTILRKTSLMELRLRHPLLGVPTKAGRLVGEIVKHQTRIIARGGLIQVETKMDEVFDPRMVTATTSTIAQETGQVLEEEEVSKHFFQLLTF